MAVSAQEFNDWLRGTGLPNGTSELSKVLGVNRATLNMQRLRGRVGEGTVVAAARAATLNPVAVLGAFTFYAALVPGLQPPTDAEIASQLTYADVTVELLKRTTTGFAHLLAGHELSEIPHPDSVRSWIDSIDSGDLRRRLAEESGVKTTNISSLLTENRLPPDLAVMAARIAGTSTATGLVATGLITAQEAGWPRYCRENVLTQMDDLALLDLTEIKLKNLRRTTKKKIDAEQATHTYWETLG